MWALSKVATGAALFAAGGFATHTWLNENMKEFEDLRIGSTKGTVGVYGFKVSPPCNKVYAYLDYHSIPYKFVNVNMPVKAELFFSPYYKRVPIAVVNGKQVNDSAKILEELQGRPYSEEEAKQMEVVDKKIIPAAELVMFATKESVGKVAPEFNEVVAWFVSQSLPKKVQRAYPGADAAQFRPTVVELLAARGTKPYLGGEQPNAVDLALFGVLRNMASLHETQEVLRLPTVQPWYDSCLHRTLHARR
eukprot:TRINITY_DN6746_c0_g1_i1.p1 TRINITY_DN6746_c0_g1~~TRINITY_DN6746_c0_g1_i1.p1  ORF type:complete len:249 (+),score=50.62 TRINITY_DN6746_c0_g1_i1:694-1440(+)